MQGMISRFITKILQKNIDNIPSVALLGARQVGKTTLAKNLGRDALYLDLESPSDCLKLSDPETFLLSQGDRLVILDEIQRMPELFATLRGIIDKNREKGRKTGQFLFLGSASMDLMRQTSESLAGRISYVEMTGLNVLEIDESYDAVRQLWLRGGFPDIYCANDDILAMERLYDLIRTYLERDIPQMGFNIPADRLMRLWTMLSHLQGETVNISKIADNLEVQRASINQYLDIFTDLLLVRKLKPWHTNVKKRLVQSPRYYIRDSGIQHCLLGINSHDDLLSNPILGKSWEGFVIENIHSVLPKRAETYFYRTSAGAEIDLVIKLPAQEIWAVEIKSGVAPKINKNFGKTCEDVGATQKFVIYGGDDEFFVQQDVTVISLRGFLQKIASLNS